MKIRSGRVVAVCGVSVLFVAFMVGTLTAQQPPRGEASGGSGIVAPPQQPPNTAHPGGKLPGNGGIQLVEVAGGFVDPTHVTSPKDGTGRLFVCERRGTIRIVGKDGKVLDEPFYDNM